MATRRRTGILTFHRCLNYGSYWQARCLLEGLRARGCDAVLLDHNSWRVTLAEWQCGLQPVLPTPVPRRDRLLYATKALKFGRAVAALRRSPRFRLDDPASMGCFDLVVVGSDEVWNLHHPWYGGRGLFFGDGVQARRLAAYAASFGNYDACSGLEPVWAAKLARFDAISVRDANSQRLVGDALGRTPALVLDPCLQFVPTPEGRWRGPRQSFIAVYGHNFSPRFARVVRRWADDRGLPLLSIGYRNAWAHQQWLTAGPHDFAHCFVNAEAVATNFFHGAVFALRYARPFVCETTPYRSIKTCCLMQAVGGERHLVAADAPPAAYAAALGEPLEPAILQRIGHLRAASAAYLDRALALAA